MKDPNAIAESLVETFERIQHEQMKGIPLLNYMVRVEAIGFQEYQGRVIGILMTPWFMNLVMMPGEDDNWDDQKLGDKLPQEFPSNTYTFLVNEVDGIGRYLTHSLYSPMSEFVNHDHALAAAQGFLDTLMVETEGKEDVVDEELLGRIMRGEETPEIDLDEFAEIEQLGDSAPPTRGNCPANAQVKKEISRRDLLRGNLLENT